MDSYDIDLEDLDRITKIDVTWTARWRKNTQSYYVETSQYLGIVVTIVKYFQNFSTTLNHLLLWFCLDKQ